MSSAAVMLIEASTHKDPQLRANALKALGELGDLTALASLLDGLDDGSIEVRNNAVQALGRLGDGSAIPKLLDILRSLELRTLDYWEDQLKLTVITALGDLKDNAAIPALKRALSDSSYRISSAARTALIRINTPEASKVLGGQS